MPRRAYAAPGAPGAPGALAAAAVAGLAILCGCVQLEDFTGRWEGDVVPAEAVRVGFEEGTVATLDLQVDSAVQASGVLATSNGRFAAAALRRPEGLSNDALATLSFDGADFVNYLLFADPKTGAPALVVVSLDPGGGVALRVVRGGDLFGVFELERP